MDWLDSATAHMEEKSRFTYREHGIGTLDTPMTQKTHPITILGCIKTETGWYRLGYDEQTKTMKPMEKVNE